MTRARPYHRAKFAAAFWPTLLLACAAAAVWYGWPQPRLSPEVTRYATQKAIINCAPQNPFTGGLLATPLEVEVYRAFLERELSEQEFFALANAISAPDGVVMCIYDHWVRDT